MYVVVAQCGFKYGVLDTNDYVVEWFSDMTLISYINEGIEISGVTDSGIIVNPLYYVPYTKLRNSFGDIFSTAHSIKKGLRNQAIILSGDKEYKLRVLRSVVQGATVSLNNFSFTADMEGWLVKLSTGICTIIPYDMFDNLFAQVISTVTYK